MLRFPVLITLLAAIACPALAQTPTLRPGETVTGELTASDPTLDDGSHYDCFVVPTQRGQRLQIDQTSEAFDSFLTVGLGSCEAIISSVSDDDGGGGMNSRLVHVATHATLTILVNSLEAAKTGAYQLSVTEVSGGTLAPASRSVPAETPAQGPATLAQASCQRLGEVVVSFHERRSVYNDIAVRMGNQSNPQIASLQPRIDTVAAWLAANGHSPRQATAADGILYEAPTTDQLTEFERRCSR